MYVCICHAVTDDQVGRAVDAGATTVDAVGESTRAGTCCTMCHDTIEDVIEERCGVCPLATMRVTQVA
jgi:bacterioferritin-associated ferredoxin